jgi:hypothetical protein
LKYGLDFNITEATVSLSEIHASLANTSLLFCAAMAVWGFWRFFRRQGLASSYWGAAIVAELLILAQGALGIFLWFGGDRPSRGAVHWLYGAALALAIPLVYTYTKGRQERPDMLLYAVGFLIMVGLVLRAMVTGS